MILIDDTDAIEIANRALRDLEIGPFDPDVASFDEHRLSVWMRQHAQRLRTLANQLPETAYIEIRGYSEMTERKPRILAYLRAEGVFEELEKRFDCARFKVVVGKENEAGEPNRRVVFVACEMKASIGARILDSMSAPLEQPGPVFL